MNFRIQPRSIAFRLIVAVLAVELLSSVLVVALSFGYERHIHFRAFDVMLHGHADSILGAVQDAEDPADNVMLDQADLHIPPEDIYEVWDASGHVLGRSDNWQGTDLTTPGKPRRDRGGDFSRLEVNGHGYGVLRMPGTRTVDPGDHGGKVRSVTILYGSPLSHPWHAVRGAVEFYAAGSLILLLVTGPLIAWLLHRGLIPLRQLASLAEEVSVDAWHFKPPASAYTTPELAPLTHALESVLQRLERSFLRQRTFVSDAAHELKTAVAVQKSSLQLLSMKPRSVAEYQTGLERCQADSLRLESLVADMLTLARAESSEPVTGPAASTDLPACIRLVVAQLESVASLRAVEVVMNLPESLAPIAVSIAGEDCIRLVSNILLNALQHSPPNSKVEVTLEADRSQKAIALVVKDQGDGIAADALPHVFERFYRGDPSRTRNTGGTGLGLAIAQAVARKAGGSVEIASQPDPNLAAQGTTVTIRLPASN